MDRPVRLYYDLDGPGPLYQRRWLLETNAEPRPSALRVDDRAIWLYG